MINIFFTVLINDYSRPLSIIRHYYHYLSTTYANYFVLYNNIRNNINFILLLMIYYIYFYSPTLSKYILFEIGELLICLVVLIWINTKQEIKQFSLNRGSVKLHFYIIVTLVFFITLFFEVTVFFYNCYQLFTFTTRYSRAEFYKIAIPVAFILYNLTP